MAHIMTFPCVIKATRNETIFDRNDFRYYIEQYMGYEAANYFDECIKDAQDEIEDMYGSTSTGDDYEAISDGYRNQLVDVMNELKEIVYEKRINRKRLEELYLNLEENL
jgi:hypothetical protein